MVTEGINRSGFGDGKEPGLSRLGKLWILFQAGMGGGLEAGGWENIERHQQELRRQFPWNSSWNSAPGCCWEFCGLPGMAEATPAIPVIPANPWKHPKPPKFLPGLGVRSLFPIPEWPGKGGVRGAGATGCWEKPSQPQPGWKRELGIYNLENADGKPGGR